jgi:inosose dehydratase
MTRFSRRNFMRAGALAAGGAWLARPTFLSAEPAAASRQRFGGFKVGIQSNSIANISPDLAKAVEAITEVKLHWGEFLGRHYAVTLDDAKIAESNAILGKGAIRMDSYFLGNINVTAEQGRTIFEFAKRAGASLLVGQPSLVKEFDIRVGIHNYGPGRQYDRAEDSIKAAAPWDWRIGYCLDTGHCMRAGEDPVDVVRRMGHRLFGMHLRDHQTIQREGRNPETVIGEGALNLKELFRALREVRFDGPLALEMYLARQDPLPAIKRSLEHMAAAAVA